MCLEFRRVLFRSKTVAEYVKLAKSDPKYAALGTLGVGSVAHLTGAWFGSIEGFAPNSIHYSTTSPFPELIGGQYPAIFEAMLPLMGHVRGGKLRTLAISGNKRHPLMPDVPTFAEAGTPGVDYEQWFGMLAPARLPQKVGAILGASIAEAIKDAEVRDRFNRLALDPAFLGPEDYNKRVLSDAARWRKVAADAGIKPVE